MRLSRVNEGLPLTIRLSPGEPPGTIMVSRPICRGSSLRLERSVSLSRTWDQSIAPGREEGGTGARYS